MAPIGRDTGWATFYPDTASDMFKFPIFALNQQINIMTDFENQPGIEENPDLAMAMKKDRNHDGQLTNQLGMFLSSNRDLNETNSQLLFTIVKLEGETEWAKEAGERMEGKIAEPTSLLAGFDQLNNSLRGEVDTYNMLVERLNQIV